MAVIMEVFAWGGRIAARVLRGAADVVDGLVGLLDAGLAAGEPGSDLWSHPERSDERDDPFERFRANAAAHDMADSLSHGTAAVARETGASHPVGEDAEDDAIATDEPVEDRMDSGEDSREEVAPCAVEPPPMPEPDVRATPTPVTDGLDGLLGRTTSPGPLGSGEEVGGGPGDASASSFGDAFRVRGTLAPGGFAGRTTPFEDQGVPRPGTRERIAAALGAARDTLESARARRASGGSAVEQDPREGGSPRGERPARARVERDGEGRAERGPKRSDASGRKVEKKKKKDKGKAARAKTSASEVAKKARTAPTDEPESSPRRTAKTTKAAGKRKSGRDSKKSGAGKRK